MKTHSIALDAHYALPTVTLATCVRIVRTDGVIACLTSRQKNFVFETETYISGRSSVTDVQSDSGLTVDNSEMTGLYDPITAADILAGLYDNATYSRFEVNYADLTMGRSKEQDGKLGVFNVDRLTFTAELHGLMEALQQSIGRSCVPTCPYILGDDECTVDLTTHTVTGTLTAVGADNATFFDTARTELGPTGGIAIIDITNANPAVVTTATPHGIPNGYAATLSGITEPASLNGVITIRNSNGDTTFELDINTTDTAAYPPYTGDGIVTALGAESGTFDYGLFTMTSGAASGISREVKSYVPTQWTTQGPMPFLVEAGDDYEMIKGCDKTGLTCRVKFFNKLNFGGDENVPGQDKVNQVGREQ